MTCTANKLRWIIMTIPVFLMVSGCGSSQDEMMARDRLEQARAVYQQAKSNPDVTGAAAVSLVNAEKDLRAAEATTNYENMAHWAYLAEKKSQTALALAEGKRAEREHEQLQKESNEAISSRREREMAARGRELERAKTEAERSKTAAEMARTEAERAKMDAERAKAESDKSRMAAERLRSEAEKTRMENQQLMMELSELKGKQTERGIVLTMGDVLFATGKSDLSIHANVSIDKLARFLANHPGRNLAIEGHTDSVGSDEYNQALSERRAEAVKKALVAKGVSAERIVAKGLGEKFPVAGNATAQERQLNRRVEVVVLNEGVKP